MRRLLWCLAIMTVAMLGSQRASGDDQAIARYIMDQLKVHQQEGNLRGFHVDMRVDSGTVWFKGHVANEDQQQLILRTGQQAGKLGVVQVVNEIDVRGSQSSDKKPAPKADTAIRSVLETTEEKPQAAAPAPRRATVEPAAKATADNQAQEATVARVSGTQSAPSLLSQTPAQAYPAPMLHSVSPAPINQSASAIGTGVGNHGAAQGHVQPAGNMPMAENYAMMQHQMQMQHQAHAHMAMNHMMHMGDGNGHPQMVGMGPVPMGHNPHMSVGVTTDNPHLPNYAWPSYAAYPNYAAATYPKQYSPTVWPYIGPFYPYPQVPLGWRRVELLWKDGWWHLEFHDTYRR